MTSPASLSLSGIFFVLPCIESYQKVDLRTITLGVPPQEVIEKEGLIIRLVQKFRKVLKKIMR